MDPSAMFGPGQYNNGYLEAKLLFTESPSMWALAKGALRTHRWSMWVVY